MDANSPNQSNSSNGVANEQQRNRTIEKLFITYQPMLTRRASAPNLDRFRDSSTSTDTSTISSLSELSPSPPIDDNVNETVDTQSIASASSENEDYDAMELPELYNNIAASLSAPNNSSNVIDENVAGPSNIVQRRLYPRIHGIKRPGDTNGGPYGKRACFQYRYCTESSESNSDSSVEEDEEEMSIDNSYEAEDEDEDSGMTFGIDYCGVLFRDVVLSEDDN